MSGADFATVLPLVELVALCIVCVAVCACVCVFFVGVSFLGGGGGNRRPSYDRHGHDTLERRQ